MTDARTRVRRLPEKAVTDVDVLHAILDEALVAHVGVVDQGVPFVLPMACARDGDSLLLHGSTGSRLMTAVAAGEPVCATVTLLDGLVYARSAFESSMHYRSAMVLGSATPVPGAEKDAALRVLTEHLLPGRTAELRTATRKELAATMVLRLPLREWSVKVGDGPPDDPPEDLDEPVWAGVLPIRYVRRDPVDAPDLRPDRPVPAHVLARFPASTDGSEPPARNDDNPWDAADMTQPNDDDLHERAREAVESLPGETALGNVDPDSEGPDAATFPDKADDK